MITEFYVRFYDPNNEDPETFVGYENSYDLYCDEDRVNDVLSQNEADIDDLENQFGSLDFEISGNTIGYVSYEIKMEDAETVFDKLCSMLTPLTIQ